MQSKFLKMRIISIALLPAVIIVIATCSRVLNCELAFFAWRGTGVAVSHLLNAGANANSTIGVHEFRQIATLHGNYSGWKLWLREAVMVWHPDTDRAPILNIAAAAPCAEPVKILLSHGADVNAIGVERRTPLLDAVMLGKVQTIKALLEAGADVTARDESGWGVVATAIHRETQNYDGTTEIMHDQLDVMKILVDAGADVNARNNEGMTLLEGIEREPHSEMFNDIKSFLRSHAH